jgi:hypothetical protein
MAENSTGMTCLIVPFQAGPISPVWAGKETKAETSNHLPKNTK